MGTAAHIKHCEGVLLTEDPSGTISSQVGMKNHVYHRPSKNAANASDE